MMCAAWSPSRPVSRARLRPLWVTFLPVSKFRFVIFAFTWLIRPASSSQTLLIGLDILQATLVASQVNLRVTEQRQRVVSEETFFVLRAHCEGLDGQRPSVQMALVQSLSNQGTGLTCPFCVLRDATPLPSHLLRSSLSSLEKRTYSPLFLLEHPSPRAPLPSPSLQLDSIGIKNR